MGLGLPVKPLCNAFLMDAVAWECGMMIGDGEGREAWGGEVMGRRLCGLVGRERSQGEQGGSGKPDGWQEVSSKDQARLRS